MAEALFRAYFLDARDIGDREVLAQVAGAAGLDVAEFLESGQGQQEVRADESWARQQGIQGVPFFLIDGGAETISGAQRPETLAAAFAHNKLTTF